MNAPILTVARALASARPVAGEYAGGDGNLAYIAHTAQWKADRAVIAEHIGAEYPGFDPAAFIAETDGPNRDDEPTPTCDICGEPDQCHPDEPLDWNGETGNHTSCEAQA